VRRTLAHAIADHEVGDPEPDEVAVAQLAIDGWFEQRQLAPVACEFEARSDRLDLLR
jgi:hypothetical protein